MPLGRLLQQPWSNAPGLLEHYSRASVSLLRGCWRKITDGAVKVFRGGWVGKDRKKPDGR